MMTQAEQALKDFCHFFGLRLIVPEAPKPKALGTPQQRAAAACVGVGVMWPTYLAQGGPLDKPGRSQVAGSYRFEVLPAPGGLMGRGRYGTIEISGDPQHLIATFQFQSGSAWRQLRQSLLDSGCVITNETSLSATVTFPLFEPGGDPAANTVGPALGVTI